MAIAINIQDLKTLRSQLGTGVADTRAALLEAEGDLQKATEILRLKGAKAYQKKADRPIGEGLIASARVPGGAVLIALACETDFVAKNERFGILANRVVDAVAAAGRRPLKDYLEFPVGDDHTLGSLIAAEAAVLGERVELVQVSYLEGESVDVYLHRSSKDLPPQLGVLLSYTGGNPEAARAVAQHIAAYAPSVVAKEDVPEDEIDREIKILTTLAHQEGKSEKITEGIIKGKMAKFVSAQALIEQPFARDSSITVGKFLKDSDMGVFGFDRIAIRG